MLGSVSDLPADLRGALEGRDLLVFDGVCMLCNGFMRFVLRFDRRQRFSFATAQSDVGQRLYQALGLPTDEFETNIVICDGFIYGHLDAAGVVLCTLGGIWRFGGIVLWLPEWLKKPLYFAVARNRYRIFGRKDTCMMPEPAVRARFLPDGYVPLGPGSGK